MHIPPPVMMLFCILIMYLGDQLLPGLKLVLPGGTFIAILLALSAMMIAIFATLSFKKTDTTVLPNKLDGMSALVTTGVYRYSRNPMYFALVLLIFSAGFFFASPLMPFVLFAFMLAITFLQIIPEEKALEETFGQEYLDYKAKTRRWI